MAKFLVSSFLLLGSLGGVHSQSNPSCPAPPSRPPPCPPPQPGFVEECQRDDMCPSGQMCCYILPYGCFRECVDDPLFVPEPIPLPEPEPDPLECPLPPNTGSVCLRPIEDCSSDDDCTSGQLCCSKGENCGSECKIGGQLECPPPPPFGICVELCGAGCPSPQRCCSNGCGQECMDPVFVPLPEPPSPPGMLTDPHLLTWGHEWFDYMGECDLVLVDAPEFAPGIPMRVHLRTTIRYDYSFIESAAISIGTDILEVESFAEYALNGVENALNTDSTVPEVGGFPVYHIQVNKKKHVFDIVTGPTENITITTFKDMVSVTFVGPTADHFGQASGMLGSFPDGTMYARDGTTILHDDINAYGQEWQVTDQEEDLFRASRAPQYPQKCRLPKADAYSTQRRRLGQTTVSKDAVSVACSQFVGHAKMACIHDVMSTGDLDIAVDGVY